MDENTSVTANRRSPDAIQTLANASNLDEPVGSDQAVKSKTVYQSGKMGIIEARKTVGIQLGLGDDFAGTPGAVAALPLEDQLKLLKALSEYIVRNPDLFTAGQIEIAKKNVNLNTLPESYSVTDMVGDFTDEFLEQGNRIVGATGVSLSRALMVAGVVAVLYFGAPYVLPKLKAAFAK